jgi:3-isopropylmalate/(R)-2-methylmalate dehydratase small subunit
VIVDDSTHAWLLANPGAEVTIDLETTALKLPTGAEVRFPLESFARYCLINGVDELGFLLSKSGDIGAYEARRARA